MDFDTNDRWDLLWTNVRLATMRDAGEAYGAIEDGALASKAGRLVFAGRASDLPGAPELIAVEVRDGAGRWITPALIDCHTHLVFAGNRSSEFEARLSGASYQEIAAAGGGILSTVRATRAATEETLFDQSKPRLDALAMEGVATVEIKSGYGLDLETELKMLRVARRLDAETPVRVVTTLLGAHALPPEYADKREAYVDLVCERMIPDAAESGLADAVDAYCEGIAFTAQECARVFEAAKTYGLPVKLHADQFSDSGGADLAARYGALSADHLEYANEESIAHMGRVGAVAVLLPGAFYALKETQKPPAPSFRRVGAPIAIASDCNPGSSPCRSLLLMLNMSCTLFGLTPEEALAGVTRNAARALGLQEETGVLDVGKSADYLIWDIESPAELSYWVDPQGPDEIYFGGEAYPNMDTIW